MLVLASLGTIVSGSDSLTTTIWPLAGPDGFEATAGDAAAAGAAGAGAVTGDPVAGLAASAGFAASAGLAAGGAGDGDGGAQAVSSPPTISAVKDRWRLRTARTKF